jgi:Fibronectin type III domain
MRKRLFVTMGGARWNSRCVSAGGLISRLTGLLFLLATGGFAAAAPKYIQGHYAVPQTPQTSVTVPYSSAQTAGDLNVVVVGWNDSATRIGSLKDSKGNVYQLAVGPTVTGALSQSIYYAKNIAAASAAVNAVTVTFSGLASYPDIRILEYSGIDTVNPVDTFAGAIGNSATSSNVSLQTTAAADLLVAGNTVQSSSIAGSGFTLRLTTSPDGDIAEDKIAATAGTYSASATLSATSGWVMQAVAFRAGVASPAPTGSKKLTLAWNANTPTNNAATNTTGYRIKLGTASKTYTQTTTLGNVTTATVSSLVSGTTYYCAVTAYDSAGLDSPISNEVVYQAP